MIVWCDKMAAVQKKQTLVIYMQHLRLWDTADHIGLAHITKFILQYQQNSYGQHV